MPRCRGRAPTRPERPETTTSPTCVEERPFENRPRSTKRLAHSVHLRVLHDDRVLVMALGQEGPGLAWFAQQSVRSELAPTWPVRPRQSGQGEPLVPGRVHPGSVLLGVAAPRRRDGLLTAPVIRRDGPQEKLGRAAKAASLAPPGQREQGGTQKSQVIGTGVGRDDGDTQTHHGAIGCSA
jgi:hypothetical protein